jgi:hypothetical protein
MKPESMSLKNQFYPDTTKPPFCLTNRWFELLNWEN